MTQTPLDPEVKEDAMDEEVRDYLTALRDLLAKARPSWASGNAVGSLNAILEIDANGNRIDWDDETDYLRKRLAEVERAQATATESAAGERKP